ncbi:MAG: hypothetical protein OXC10_05895 [Rhodospirillaceae bacterium]|nr:hypothetical protein [Rhodospirillaceae bacterium]
MTELTENLAENDGVHGSAGVDGGESSATVAAPAKFLDPETGELRVDALMKSYMALEKRMGAGEHLNGGGPRGRDTDGAVPDNSFADGSGGEDAGDPPAGAEPEDPAGDADDGDDTHPDAVPDSPEDYRIESGHPWLGNDAELNGVLHENGFTQGQAQLVYDVAHEYVLPLLDRMAGEIAGLRGERQLREVFPGDDWEARAEQTRQWGASALPEDLYGTLAATPAGVAAMHRMMQHGEPDFLSRNGPAGPAADEAELRSLMNDPRYWRDHDPAVLAKVRDGFQRLYPD